MSKRGPFLAFWKTHWYIAHFSICNFVQNLPISQGFQGIILYITQHVHKYHIELILHRIRTTFLIFWQYNYNLYMQEKIVHYCRKYKGHYLTERLDSKTILSSGSPIWVYWFVGKKVIIVQNITNVGFHGKPLIFFYFCDLVFMRSAEVRRPSLGTRWFQFFFFAFHEYHQSFQFFCQRFREYHQKFKK